MSKAYCHYLLLAYLKAVSFLKPLFINLFCAFLQKFARDA